MSDAPPSASRLTPILERLAIALTVFALILRWTSAGEAVGTPLFINLLFWVAPALWIVARALDGGATWRFTGAELPLVALCIVSLVSVQRAPHKLPALEQAMATLSFSLLLVFLASAVGRELLVSILLPTLFALAFYAGYQLLFYPPDKLLRAYDPTVFGPMTVEMKRRIESNRIFATFAGPNQFGAFLALLLPIAGSLLMDPPSRLLKAVPVVLGLGALALTRSLGATLGLGAGIVAFAALWRSRERGRAAAVSIGLAGAGVALLLVLFTPILSKAAEKSYSLHVRRAYWQAAGKTFARAPVLGVGLNNFQEFYPQDKPETPTETRHAHNDYLQTLAETGLVGAAALAWLVAFGLRRALIRDASPGGPAPAHPPALIPASVAGALAAAWALGALDWDAAMVIGLGWLGWHFLGPKVSLPAAGPALRVGAAAGLIALLVHMNVDFDLYDPKTASFFFVAIALVTMLQGKAFDVKLSVAACGGGAVLLLAVVFPLLTLVVPRALAADNEVELGRRALHELEDGARRSRSPEEVLQDLRRLSRSAQGHNPFLVEAYVLQAEGEALAWRRTPKSAGALTRLQESDETAIQALENAVRLNPRSAGIHATKARLHSEFARGYARMSPAPPVAEARRQDHSQRALRDAEAAVELYPTFAPHRAELARLLAEDGLRDEAVAQYREALRLSDLAARDLYPLDRMQVDRTVIEKAINDILKPQ